MKPVFAQAKMAVEIIYNNIDSLPHPDMGVLRLVYFGHKSEGQKKITRATAEALVMLLEANGQFICNGLSDAVQLLTDRGYVVVEPGDLLAPAEDPVPTQVPGGDPDLSLIPLFSSVGGAE